MQNRRLCLRWFEPNTCHHNTCHHNTPGGYFRFTNKDLRDAFKLTFKADPADGGQMDRQTLRAILLIGLEDRVHYGRHATGLTEGPDGATLHFGDGTSVTASVAVGADGSSSLLRAQVLPDHEPADTRSMALYGRTPLVVGGRPMLPRPWARAEYSQSATNPGTPCSSPRCGSANRPPTRSPASPPDTSPPLTPTT
jgi:2-polyprenyl-6-methoxyphenol hydroxylase-like FAD-dependent oxidoreductase